MKVLIVNSHSLQSKILERILKFLGFYVNTASSAKQASRQLQQNKADLLLLSYYLPDQNSLDFLKKARELDFLQDTKILLSTHSLKEEIPVIAITNGADDVIAEPIHLGEFILKLTALTGKKFSSAIFNELRNEVREIHNQNSSRMDYARLWIHKGDEHKGHSTYASAMFIRIANITSLTSELSPKQLSEILNTIFIGVSKMVYRSRGSVHYIRGSSILITFGAPLTYDNNTLDASLCAFRLQGFFKEFNANRPEYLKEPISFAIGISTGRITAAQVHSMRRSPSTVLGQPIEKASGLAYLARQLNNNILIDTETNNSICDYAQSKEVDFSEFAVLSQVYHLKKVYELESVDENKILQLPNFEKQLGSKTGVDEEEYDKL